MKEWKYENINEWKSESMKEWKYENINEWKCERMKASSCLSSHKTGKHSLWLQHWQTFHLNIYKCSEDPKLTGISDELQIRQNKFVQPKEWLLGKLTWAVGDCCVEKIWKDCGERAEERRGRYLTCGRAHLWLWYNGLSLGLYIIGWVLVKCYNIMASVFGLVFI